jgi:hypothetical protein
MGTRFVSLGAAVMVLSLAACAGPHSGAPSTPTPSASPTGRAVTGLVFAFGVGARNVLDTTRGTFTKDMIVASPITIPMELSRSEMARIVQKMDEIGFFSYPVALTVPAGSRGGQMTPFSTYRFAVRTGAVTKRVQWDDEFATGDERALGLRSLADLIENIVVARPDYRQLPEPEGGYL